MAYELMKLPYRYDALEPYIDARTMEIHHTKHHQTYVNNLNKALEGQPDLAKRDLMDLFAHIGEVPEIIRQAVINNGGGVANHNFFWNIMGPQQGGEPKGELASLLSGTFGNFRNFREKLSQAAISRFGSGWAWAGFDQGGKLTILSTPNQDHPILHGLRPFVGVDVWEHAYYLKYQNRRAEYVDAWWNTINWDRVQESFKKLVRE